MGRQNPPGQGRLDCVDAGLVDGFVDQQGGAARRIDVEAPDHSTVGPGIRGADRVAGIARDLERIGIRLGGILGYSFLKNRSVEIDYQAETLTFFEEPSADEPCQDRNETNVCFWVPLESNTEEDMIPALEAFFINGIPVRVSLDTGSSLALTVNPKTMDSLGIDYTIDEGKTVIVRGARGEVERQSGVLASVRIGPFQIENVPALFTEENFDVSSPRLGNVGNKILSQFTVTFDYVNSRIVFKKPAGHE